jgi:hypothetical protein
MSRGPVRGARAPQREAHATRGECRVGPPGRVLEADHESPAARAPHARSEIDAAPAAAPAQQVAPLPPAQRRDHPPWLRARGGRARAATGPCARRAPSAGAGPSVSGGRGGRVREGPAGRRRGPDRRGRPSSDSARPARARTAVRPPPPRGSPPAQARWRRSAPRAAPHGRSGHRAKPQARRWGCLRHRASPGRRRRASRGQSPDLGTRERAVIGRRSRIAAERPRVAVGSLGQRLGRRAL